MQRSLLFRPFFATDDPAQAGLPQAVRVATQTADGLRLTHWYAPPRDPGAPILVFFHGNAGHVAWMADKARPFLQAGMGVFLTGYRGYSGNPGSPSEAGLYADARSAIDWLAAHAAGHPLALYGESLGSGVAVQMATERAVGAVVLEAPYTSIPDVAERRYPLVPVQLLARDRFDSKSKIAAIGAPLLVIHGELDTLVPPAQGRALFEAAKEPKAAAFIPEAGHNDLYAWGAGAKAVAFVAAYLTKGLSSGGAVGGR
jgi:fermentation-respiration switch protein FrsA (DUF1100 family)